MFGLALTNSYLDKIEFKGDYLIRFVCIVIVSFH